MNARYWLTAILAGSASVALADTAPFAPTEKPAGGVPVAAAKPVARGNLLPTRARGDAFGLATAERPAPARLAPPFVDAEPLKFPDTLEAIFYSRSRPVRFRLLISLSDTPFREKWEKTLKVLFDTFDRDRNGYLNRYELDQAIPVDGVRSLFNGGYYSRMGLGTPPLETLDRDGDNRLSFAEFTHYYRPAVADLVKARAVNAPSGEQDNLTKQLFAKLDANNDGKMSKAELQSAERILLALDGDEDECASAAELLQNSGQTQFARVAVSTTSNSVPQAGPQDVVVYANGIPGLIVQKIVNKYDKNNDHELTAEEIGFDADSFARLDANGNKKLSATELDGWRTSPPDVVVLMAFNAKAAGKVSAAPTLKTWPAGLELRQAEPSRLVIRVGTQTAEFGVAMAAKDARKQQVEMLARNVFNGRDAVYEQDLSGPQNQFARVVFDSADFNGDGKLTKAEFEKYIDVQKTAGEPALAVTYVIRTPNLFQMLDENADSKLGVRELRTAWDRMIVLEPAGSEAVTKSVMQPSVNFRLASAAYSGFDQPVYAANMGITIPTPGTGSTPIWFTKMDRNGDGDVSRAEFLGLDADFAKIDTNKDGLISVAEVQAYEKVVRPAKK